LTNSLLIFPALDQQLKDLVGEEVFNLVVGVLVRNGTGTAKVFYRGEIWDAICPDEVSVGEFVRVTGVKGMKLTVQERA